MCSRPSDRELEPIPSINDLRKSRGGYFVLWATPLGENTPFEVTREVPVIIEDRCPTSPYCPGERIPRIEPSAGSARPARTWSYAEDRSFEVDAEACPFGFRSKAECYRHINTVAFKKGCVPRAMLRAYASFLSSIGYAIDIESFEEDDIRGDRILIAHGPIYNFHEFRIEIGPGGVRLFMVRNPYENQKPKTAERYM